eukprot:CAMPEP_0204575798 /NCGR_PEP_ID=MMETSP0661-20131031/41401_1 /ASSEMBLY_ACC=CAM_ASM_000606 /TAXON_ID=109239 /ORGANISM="Alexandrium margalefi, Strain AMGDE01CS-322" /LENGTH=206 /DNA_ID=CAMNT_0051584471 /DNA_START=110 /DNA_END=730 /DNA_ORIENTATION=+
MPLTVIKVGESGSGSRGVSLASDRGNLGKSIDEQDMKLSPGPKEGSISVSISSGCDADGFLIALLDKAEQDVHIEVRTTKSGEFGVCVGLMTLQEYDDVTKSGGSSAMPTDRMVTFALSGEVSEFSRLHSSVQSNSSRARLYVTKIEDRAVLHCDGKAMGSAPLGSHWFVAGEGHDGDYGDPQVVLRMVEGTENDAACGDRGCLLL